MERLARIKSSHGTTGGKLGFPRGDCRLHLCPVLLALGHGILVGCDGGEATLSDGKMTEVAGE